MACGLSLQLLFPTAWQGGSERECLRVSLPRDSSRSCQLLAQSHNGTCTSNLSLTSARSKEKADRISQPLDTRSSMYLQRRKELRIWKPTPFPTLFCLFLVSIDLNYHFSTFCLLQWEDHQIQSEKAMLTVSTRGKAKSKQQLGSEVPTYLCLVTPVPSHPTPDEYTIKKN